jgi:hypothetical protein
MSPTVPSVPFQVDLALEDVKIDRMTSPEAGAGMSLRSD